MNKYALIQKQSLPLPVKIQMSLSRIREALRETRDQMYISISGGRDSRVLQHLVQSVAPAIKAVYFNTGVEYPDVDEAAQSLADIIVKPKMSFKSVLDKYGYPVVSKEIAQFVGDVQKTKSAKLRNIRLWGRNGDCTGYSRISNKWRFLTEADFNISAKCCDVFKKNPAKSFEKKSGLTPFIGTLAEDSGLRLQSYLAEGCNSFGTLRKSSRPLSFWKHSDIKEYVEIHRLSIPPVYSFTEHTGCMFCLFGCGFSDFNKLSLLEQHYPKQYLRAEKLGLVRVMQWIRDRRGVSNLKPVMWNLC